MTLYYYYFGERGPFVNWSGFIHRTNLDKNRSSLIKKNEIKCFRKLYKPVSKQGRERYRKTTPTSITAAIVRTCEEGHKKPFVKWQKQIKVYIFSIEVAIFKFFLFLLWRFFLGLTKRLKLLFAGQIWKFCEDPIIAHAHFSLMNWTVNQNNPFKIVFFLISLRSLCVYVLKQLFFSISVNSGIRNIYLFGVVFVSLFHMRIFSVIRFSALRYAFVIVSFRSSIVASSY